MKKREQIARATLRETLLDVPNGHPLLLARIDRSDATALSRAPAREAASGRARQVSLTLLRRDPQRLLLTAVPPPAYQGAASPIHLRGDAMRVTAGRDSLNAEFTTPDAQELLAAKLRRAAARASREVILRIPRRNLLKLIPDRDQAPARDVEAKRLGESGANLAAVVWTEEAFEDRET